MKGIDLGIKNECATIRKHMNGINKELEKIRDRLALMDKGSGVQYVDSTLRDLLIDMIDNGIPQAIIADKLGISRPSVWNAVRRMKREPD